MDEEHRTPRRNLQSSKGDELGLAIEKKRPSGAADSECATVSVEMAGRILGISRGAAYARAEDGSLPTIRLGKRLLVPKAALDKLLMTA
jgi:excisionase family DNA binding protein